MQRRKGSKAHSGQKTIGFAFFPLCAFASLRLCVGNKLPYFVSTLAIIVFVAIAGQAYMQADMSERQNNHSQKTDAAPVGDWGGEHISLQLSERGGKLEFDCAHGTIDQRITLDRQGGFDVTGTFVEEHGGPVRQNERGRSHQVRYTGRVREGKMKLTIRQSNTKKIVGTFTLALGEEAMLVKCR